MVGLTQNNVCLGLNKGKRVLHISFKKYFLLKHHGIKLKE